MSQLLRLLLGDLRHDRIAVFCQALALAAVLVPLMVLLGLRAGIIGTLIARMDADPAMRLILPEVTGANRFDAAWFRQWSARPDVAFLLPSTRAIAAQVDLGTDSATLRVAWLPTAPGDPIAAGPVLAEGMDQVSLSTEAARRLNVKPGDRLTAAVERTRGGRVEPVAFPLRVRDIVPVERSPGISAYVSLPLLAAVQSYRDGYAVPAMGWAGDGAAPEIETYPLFRLYSASIRDVAPLAADLRAAGVTVATREAEIASTLGLDRSLRAILAVIIAVAAVGLLVSLAAGQFAALRRKRRDLAILKLCGYGPGWLAALPIGQALAVAAIGVLIALGLYAAAAAAINDLFGASLGANEAACRLSGQNLAAIIVITLATACLPGLAAGLVAARVDPAEELRDV
jgi:putative ABC transport system permease protein